MTGLFITFEGIEGSGKSTQQRLLAEYLTGRGVDVVVTREPGGTVVSDCIREILLDPQNGRLDAWSEALLYAASRAQLVAEVIEPALAEGKTVLCDRYVDSSVAYQVYGRGLPHEDVLAVNRPATRGIEPSLTILLMMPTEEGLARATRRAADRIEREAIEFHHRVAEGYRRLTEENPRRIRVFDARLPRDDIHAGVRAVVDELIF